MKRNVSRRTGGGYVMNAFSFDITDNSLIVKQENMYPEWVTTERFYNCENFGQIFVKGEPFLRKMLGRKQNKR